MNDSVNTGGNPGKNNMSFGSGNLGDSDGTPKAKAKTDGLTIVGTALTENKESKEQK